MERITRFRATVVLLFFIILAGIFSFRLYSLQVIETEGKADNTTTFVTYTRVKAARGDILDRNGNALVSNRASYDLVFNYYIINNAENTNEQLLKLIRLCRELEIEYTDTFPVTRTRPFEYTLEEYSTTQQGYFQAYLANRDWDSDITAPLLMRRLRDAYDIPVEWSEEDARAVIGLRYELALRAGITNLPNYVFLEDAEDSQLSAIRELNIPGLLVEPSTVREYNTSYAAHILGYVGDMSPAQWEYFKDIDGYEMDSQVGQDGLEEAFEEYLHGVDGLRRDVHTADGTLVSSTYEVEPQAGSNVEVSIDLNLQRVAEDELAAKLEELRAQEEDEDGVDAEGGAVVAMEVKTGEILVCGSYPTYDLETFFENYNETLKAEYNPLFNRALQGMYPPGSTFKPTMVTAGINNGYVNSTYEIEDMGVFRKYEADGFKPSCLAWSQSFDVHENVNAAKALEVSCNYYFYVLGDMMPIEVIDETAKGFGLGESTGVELYEEIGYRANEETKQKLYSGYDAYMYAADKVLASIGQSDNRFTPLQLCVYASTLANQGKRYAATFMNRVVSSDYTSLLENKEPQLISTMEVKEEAYQAYLAGMQQVCTSSKGTAYRTFGDYPIAVAAKTGTAETDKQGRSDNAAFICFAPADDPQIAVAVYGEMAGHGSALASVAKSILDVYFDVDEVGDITVYENQVS